MQSKWNELRARDAIETYAEKGVSEDLALRVYTTRLLGRDPLLVLHGGGNTSVKTRATDDLGVEHEVIAVKGSGWDMADIEPQGLPTVKLEPLRKLRALSALSDEAMVNVQRLNLLDAGAPNPSVETLLHAFLPHKFIDHTHAAAVLSLVDQPDGEALAREVYDGRMGIVPYIAPGFGLAKAAAEIFENNPDVEGLILHKHGIFTFGATAREAYERMIEMVSLAEARLRQGRPVVFQSRDLAGELAEVAEVAPIIRGAVALPADKPGGEPTRFVMTFRTGPEILCYVNGAELAEYSQRGVVTPDHIIRTKNTPLVLSPPEPGKLDDFAREVQEKVAAFAASYDAYFGRENERVGGIKSKLDSAPRVVLVPGLGLFGIGRTAKDADMAADLAENTVRVVTDAEGIGRYEPLPESDLFELEYWSLEQAKLKGAVVKPLTGQVALVTGAGAIGTATAKALAADGAAVAILDIDGALAEKAAKPIKGLGFECDVTKPAEVRDAFAKDLRALRRRGHRRVECRRSLAGPHRRCVGRAAAPELRAQFLRPSDRGEGGGAHHAEAGHRRRAPVQSLQAGGEPRRQFRALRPAQGRRHAAHAPIRARLWPGPHPLERRQRRSDPERSPHRRHDQGALCRARAVGGGIYERQPARRGGPRRGRGAVLRVPGQVVQNHRPYRDGGRRQHRRCAALRLTSSHQKSSWPGLSRPSTY